MDFSVAVLVSIDKRNVYTLYTPFLGGTHFRGVSLAELLDDVALHLMEHVPRSSPHAITALPFCPHVELRRALGSVEVREDGKKTGVWEGRFPVVIRHWPGESFYIATVPTLGTHTFALKSPFFVEPALSRFLQTIADEQGLHTIERAVSGAVDYIELLTVDVDLPTVLPSRKPRKTRKKTKADRKRDRKKSREERDKPQPRQIVPPVTLREVGVNLNHRATDGRLGKTWGRDELVVELTRLLLRPGAAILLVGPHGVGKSALVRAIVQRLVDRNLPLHLRNEVWAIDSNRLIAGMSWVGGWEQRVRRMVDELSARNDILYVDDLPSLVYAGRSAQSEAHAAEFLEPHIARGELRIIGECTPERLEATREEAPGFFARFQLVQIPELSEEQTLNLLVAARREVEIEERARVHHDALEAVLGLTRRFMPQRALPGKAVDLFQRLLADYHKVEVNDFGERSISRDTLVDFFARETGLPGFILWEQQAMAWTDLHAAFAERIIGQPAAAEAAADVVAVLQHGLNDPHKPLATMLFVGPTGVGKTETAKALAAFLFGSKERMIRFDMSEFRDPWSAARLFGDRLNPEGELTRRVRESPFAVVLFDEIEKADPSIFDAFLQVFGEGRLTNAAGFTTDFCNTILIMTSNLGVRQAQHSLGFGDLAASQSDLHYKKAAEGFFRPEFFNRIDRIIAFRALGRDSIEPLVRRTLLDILSRRGLKRAGVVVHVEAELVDVLVDLGFDPRYGARSMKRALEQRLTVPLATHLVTQPIDATTLVQLFQRGDDIGMEIWSLHDLAVQPVPVAAPASRAELRPRFDVLRAQLDALERSELVQRSAQRRAELLGVFNAGALAAEGMTLLENLNELLAQLHHLHQLLDEFYENQLASWDFVEQIDILVPPIMESHGHKPYQVATQLPVRPARDAQLAAAATELLGLEHSLAELDLRGRALEGEPSWALVRLLPFNEEPAAASWATALATMYAAVWSSFARADLLRLDDGVWTRSDDLRLAAGAAVALYGYGLDVLVGEEVGFHVATAVQGPDLHCNIARIEIVDRSDAEPTEILTRLDAEFAAWRARRRQGDLVDNPRPQLPVRRRYHNAACTDVETGITFSADAFPVGPIRDSAFATGLRDLLLRRHLNHLRNTS